MKPPKSAARASKAYSEWNSEGRLSRFRRWQAANFDFIGPLAGFPKIALQLHPQPVIGRAPTDLFQPNRHVRRKAAMAVQQIGKRLAGDAERFGRGGHGQIQRL